MAMNRPTKTSRTQGRDNICQPTLQGGIRKQRPGSKTRRESTNDERKKDKVANVTISTPSYKGPDESRSSAGNTFAESVAPITNFFKEIIHFATRHRAPQTPNLPLFPLSNLTDLINSTMSFVEALNATANLVSENGTSSGICGPCRPRTNGTTNGENNGTTTTGGDDGTTTEENGPSVLKKLRDWIQSIIASGGEIQISGSTLQEWVEQLLSYPGAIWQRVVGDSPWAGLHLFFERVFGIQIPVATLQTIVNQRGILFIGVALIGVTCWRWTPRAGGNPIPPAQRPALPPAQRTGRQPQNPLQQQLQLQPNQPQPQMHQILRSHNRRAGTHWEVLLSNGRVEEFLERDCVSHPGWLQLMQTFYANAALVQ